MEEIETEREREREREREKKKGLTTLSCINLRAMKSSD